MTPSGIEPAIFRFVAQHLNHCATAVQYQYEEVLLIHVKNKHGDRDILQWADYKMPPTNMVCSC